MVAGPAWRGGDWLVAEEIGGRLRPDQVGDLFRRIADNMELPPLTIRQLRQSHATALLAAGVPTKVVQERLGHLVDRHDDERLLGGSARNAAGRGGVTGGDHRRIVGKIVGAGSDLDDVPD